MTEFKSYEKTPLICNISNHITVPRVRTSQYTWYHVWNATWYQ